MRRFVALALLVCSSLSALHFSSPSVCWDWCDSSFSGGGEVLYWKPADCGYSYATLPGAAVDDDPIISETFTVKSDYDWGFRVFAGYQQECFFARVGYLWLETSGSGETRQEGTTTLNPFLINIPNGFTNPDALAQLRYRHQHLDLKVGQFIHKGRGCDVYGFGRGRWAYLERKTALTVDADNTQMELETSSFAQVSKFNGGGAGVGIGGRFGVCNGLGFKGELSVLGLVGERRLPTSVVVPFPGATTTNPTIADFDRQTCLVPGMDFRVAVHYAWACLCTSLNLEFGYEMNYYWKALQYQRNEQAQTQYDCHDVGFGGPYLSVKVSF